LKPSLIGKKVASETLGDTGKRKSKAVGGNPGRGCIPNDHMPMQNSNLGDDKVRCTGRASELRNLGEVKKTPALRLEKKRIGGGSGGE